MNIIANDLTKRNRDFLFDRFNILLFEYTIISIQRQANEQLVPTRTPILPQSSVNIILNDKQEKASTIALHRVSLKCPLALIIACPGSLRTLNVVYTTKKRAITGSI